MNFSCLTYVSDFNTERYFSIYFNKQAKTKIIYDELEEKQREKLKKREEDMKRIGEIERRIAHLEANYKRKEDLFNENHKVKVVDSEPFADIS